MIALWILGILAVLILLLCLTRVGVLARFGGELAVTVKLGLFRIQVLPASKKPPKHEKTTEKDTEPNRPPKGKPARKAFPKPSFGGDQGGPANPVAAAEKSAEPHPQGRSDRPAGLIGNSGRSDGAGGRRPAVRRAARSGLGRGCRCWTAAGDPPSPHPSGCGFYRRGDKASGNRGNIRPGSARCCGSA